MRSCSVSWFRTIVRANLVELWPTIVIARSLVLCLNFHINKHLKKKTTQLEETCGQVDSCDILARLLAPRGTTGSCAVRTVNGGAVVSSQQLCARAVLDHGDLNHYAITITNHKRLVHKSTVGQVRYLHHFLISKLELYKAIFRKCGIVRFLTLTYVCTNCACKRSRPFLT